MASLSCQVSSRTRRYWATETKVCFNAISKSSSVSAASHSSIGSIAPAAPTRHSTTWAAVRITRRVASLGRGSRAPFLPAHTLTTARWIRLTPTAGVTVTTAIAIPGTAAIVIITTASTAPTIGWWGAPWGWGAARVTCRVNGQVIGKVQFIHILALPSAHFSPIEFTLWKINWMDDIFKCPIMFCYTWLISAVMYPSTGNSWALLPVSACHWFEKPFPFRAPRVRTAG